MSDQKSTIIFVGEVKKHECLYNYRLPEYSRKDLTEKAWQEVADKVNMSAAECKEKWRNLRTVFRRKMKPPASGSRANRKTYYLAEAMQFCLPFMKMVGPPSCGILPTVTRKEIADNERRDESSVFAEDSTYFLQTQAAVVSPKPTESEGQTSKLHKHGTGLVQSTSSGDRRDIVQRIKASVDEDKCIKTRLEAIVKRDEEFKIDKIEALKMFLLSLIPELDEFNDSQIRLFKRRVFTVIDEISSSTESQFQPTLLCNTTLSSPQSVSSNTSGTPLSSPSPI